jgi:adenylate cyclase
VDSSLQAFFDLAPDLVCIRSREGYFQQVNAVWTETLGWTVAELQAQPWIEWVHPEDIEQTLAMERQCEVGLASPTTVQYKNRYRHKNGSYRWLQWRLSPYQNGLSYGMAEDVTEHSWSGNRALRTGIQEAVKLRDSAISASSVGIVIADVNLPGMPLIYINPAFEQITGYSAAEVLGTNCRFLQGQDTDQAAIHELRTAIQAGVDCTVTLRNYRQDGELFWNELHISPIYDDQGRLTHFVGVQSDVSDRKRAEAALQAETAKSERLLLNILPRATVDRLKAFQIELMQPHPEALIADRFDDATVLFADIVGFTELSSRLSPTQLVNLLNRIFSGFDQLSEQYGLEKIKTIGDEYMVVAGLPHPHAQPTQAIAEMALAMQNQCATERLDGGDRITLRIGIHTGPVVAGVIGTKKFSYDLWGDTVNLASRMESQGEAGKIQVTQAVYDRLHPDYEFAERGIIQVKGKGAMRSYWLQGRKVANAPTQDSDGDRKSTSGAVVSAARDAGL